MTDLRKIIYDKRSLNGALIQAAGAFLENPVEGLSWKEVEDMRSELKVIKERVFGYLTEVESFILDQATDWQEQWDLAHKLYMPYNEPYNPEDIDVEALTKEFVIAGLNELLASQAATSIKNPIED